MVYIHFLKLFSFYSYHLNRILGIIALPRHLHFQLCQLWDAGIQLIPEDLRGLRLQPGLLPVKSQPPLSSHHFQVELEEALQELEHSEESVMLNPCVPKPPG